MATLDSGIYNALMQPRKSAFDYANEFEQQDAMREQRGQARQLNALQIQAAQTQDQQAQQGIADDRAYREAAKAFGTDHQANYNALLQRGLVRQATDYQKQALEGLKTKGEINKNDAQAGKFKVDTEKTQFEMEQARRQQHLQELVGVQDVQGAMAWLDAGQASGELKPENVAAVKQQLQANPGMFQQWRNNAIAAGFTLQQQRDNEWKQREFQLKTDQFGETVRHNKSSEGLTTRGQNLTDARAREGNAIKAAEVQAGGKPPPGYRWKADGTLEAIPGGPGDKLPEAQQKQVVGTHNLSNAIKEYRSALSGFGKLDALNPGARAEMGTKYNNMLLQAKEAYNLGVLNGPDYQILQSVVADPRSLMGVITPTSSLDKQAAELDRIMQGIAATSGNRRPQDGPAPVPQADPQRGGASPRKSPSVSNW